MKPCRNSSSRSKRIGANTPPYRALAACYVNPIKVVRHALQDAASVAGRSPITEAMVPEKPEPKAAPMMPPGGGMGGMDF